ncbi:hypothetical protein [Rhodopseudomonas telluris]|uniref:Uncharacterized protein n=1 Tax=Rhodopseudomonas telluris TaxID=644215 RepID=A0ABV6EZM9_9BRAD
MAFGRSAFGRAAFGRSAVGSSILVTPTAGVVAVSSGALHAAVGATPNSAVNTAVAGSIQALLSSSASGSFAHRGERSSFKIAFTPGGASFGVVEGTVQALLSSSASGLMAHQGAAAIASTAVNPAAGHIVGVFGALHATLGITPASAQIVVKSGSGIAAGIPGNFNPAALAVVGGKLHVTINGVPGDRYRNLRSRAFGRIAFGHLTETVHALMPSRLIVTQQGSTASSVALHPASGQIATRAATVRGAVTAKPSSASMAIVPGRFPVRARVAVFTLD